MKRSLEKIFARADKPKHKNRSTFPVPVDYIKRIFGLDQDGYKDGCQAGTIFNSPMTSSPKIKKG